MVAAHQPCGFAARSLRGSARRSSRLMGVRAFVFKNRGALLVIPALILAVFGKPNTDSILAGLPTAFAGEAIRCWAVGYSGTTTRADQVTAPQLVTAGPYAYVRNPLYIGNLDRKSV